MIRRRTFLRLLAGGAATAAAGGLGACTGDGPTDDLQPPFIRFTLTKRPWVHLVGPGRASLRFETREDLEIVPAIFGADGVPAFTAARSVADVGLPWGLETAPNPLDEPGDHVLHEILLDGLTPGEDYRWSMLDGDGAPIEGTFQAPPGPNTPVVIAWLADTMYPASSDVARALGDHGPQLVIHGGDIQYRTNPADTWNGFFLAMQPLFSQAAVQLCFGNHELDTEDEASEFYDRLFAGKGGEAGRWHAVRFGRALVVCLDSETGGLTDPEGAQVAWARATLRAAVADGLVPILALHRPTYTLSKYGPSNLVARDVVHGLAKDFGAPLVLAGHVHGYERFLVDGVTYVIDGGGGALLTNLDERRDEIEAARPGEPALRVAASRSFGGTIVEVLADRIKLSRYDRDGVRIDATEVTA